MNKYSTVRSIVLLAHFFPVVTSLLDILDILESQLDRFAVLCHLEKNGIVAVLRGLSTRRSNAAKHAKCL